ncbi:PDR/VanB family oxidoreductase [Alteromonas lipolytica]|uniref:Oxidoreductase n=1 Tax=Alteromonas lipolytica TaxID=1856405 RepID=A0A1E8FDG5_9ALTE|nr:PDR/VanB family oxidoreductase [Alteromonas lipolytica]OFI33974.1 hypothetical protein BFC17_20685 [Alteromonas lipolytica]GGF66767.1 vanillate O-demethylase oxidoreductase (vanillate degradation ferredoxin-like protein) [Alteromonas lipolytica]
MISVIVAEYEKLSDSVLKLTFSPINGEALPPFTAGAHIDVKINDNLVRQYSICSAASAKNVYSIAVLNDANSRGGSAQIHREFKAGQIVEISAPRNLFELGDHSAPVLLIGAGIGITPLLSMAYSLAERGQDFTICYLHKPAEQVAFQSDLLSEPFKGKSVLIPSVDRQTTRQQLNDLIGKYREGQHVYTCGPAGFMDLVFELAEAQHWPAESLHKEMFHNDVSGNTPDRSFTLHLTKSARSIQVSAQQTALEALDEAGIEIDASCEQGVCGICLLNVVDGKVDHRDAFLTEEEKQQHKQFTPCCSRALSSSLSIEL